MCHRDTLIQTSGLPGACLRVIGSRWMFFPSYWLHTVAHTESDLPFYRQSYWGSPPLDQWCPHFPGLWTPLPFSLRPAKETHGSHKHLTKDPLEARRTQNDNLINISWHFYFPQEPFLQPLSWHSAAKMYGAVSERRRLSQKGQIRELRKADVRWILTKLQSQITGIQKPQWSLTKHTGVVCCKLILQLPRFTLKTVKLN